MHVFLSTLAVLGSQLIPLVIIAPSAAARRVKISSRLNDLQAGSTSEQHVDDSSEVNASGHARSTLMEEHARVDLSQIMMQAVKTQISSLIGHQDSELESLLPILTPWVARSVFLNAYGGGEMLPMQPTDCASSSPESVSGESEREECIFDDTNYVLEGRLCGPTSPIGFDPSDMCPGALFQHEDFSNMTSQYGPFDPHGVNPLEYYFDERKLVDWAPVPYYQHVCHSTAVAMERLLTASKTGGELATEQDFPNRVFQPVTGENGSLEIDVSLSKALKEKNSRLVLHMLSGQTTDDRSSAQSGHSWILVKGRDPASPTTVELFESWASDATQHLCSQADCFFDANQNFANRYVLSAEELVGNLTIAARGDLEWASREHPEGTEKQRQQCEVRQKAMKTFSAFASVCGDWKREGDEGDEQSGQKAAPIVFEKNERERLWFRSNKLASQDVIKIRWAHRVSLTIASFEAWAKAVSVANAGLYLKSTSGRLTSELNQAKTAASLKGSSVSKDGVAHSCAASSSITAMIILLTHGVYLLPCLLG